MNGQMFAKEQPLRIILPVYDFMKNTIMSVPAGLF